MAHRDGYHAGDIVMLRSGGPLMTVEEAEADGEIHCSFFVEGHLEHATFREEALMKPFQSQPVEEDQE